jgi:hypothetical protein
LPKFKPHRWSEMREMKKSIRKLRNLGREQILKRLKMIEENQELPNDMLTMFLKEQSRHDFMNFPILHISEIVILLLR